MQTPVVAVHRRRVRFDPDPELARLREVSPVVRIELPRYTTAGPAWAWLVTRYEDVREVLADAQRFSTALTAVGERSQGDGFLVAYDPPEHTRLRRMVSAPFTGNQIRHLRPRIEVMVAECLDAIAEAGPPVDLMETFALPIPSLVICELLGVPYPDRAGFQHTSKARIDLAATAAERMAARTQSRHYMAQLVTRQRLEPGASLLGMLVRDHGSELTDAELVGIGDLLLFAGHETTANMLGLGTALLLHHPDQLSVMRERPDQVADAVEELLRFLSVVSAGTARTAVIDTTIGGQQIKAGELVVCSLPAANRDRAFADDADRLDLTRAARPHVAFGHGIHHCLGAPLARLEMEIAFPALLRRFPTLRLAVPVEEIPFLTHSVVYGVRSLPVAW
ncbi:cytochrome P450 [Rhizocola hellebori]|nr:cytochrome P450 [Rhizocola hellebori]